MKTQLDGKELPSQEQLKAVFDYQPNGFLIWKISKGRVKKGTVAGYKRKDGYHAIRFEIEKYLAHRLIWVYHGNTIPSGFVLDHIDGDPENNRIENLQLVTQGQNCQKRGPRKDNNSGFRGVSFHKPTNKWVAHIYVNGAKMHLGLFTVAEEAARTYDLAAIKYYGDFANTNFPMGDYKDAA